MLRLLLDEQISPDVADGLRRKAKGLIVQCIAEWDEGRSQGVADEVILSEASRQKLVLVTYDRRTIPPVLKNWAAEARDHGGVVFVEPESIPPADFGGLIRALRSLWLETGEWDWTNRIVTLRRD